MDANVNEIGLAQQRARSDKGRRLALLIGLLRGDAADKLAAGHVRGDLIIEVGGGDQDICAAQILECSDHLKRRTIPGHIQALDLRMLLHQLFRGLIGGFDTGKIFFCHQLDIAVIFQKHLLSRLIPSSGQRSAVGDKTHLRICPAAEKIPEKAPSILAVFTLVDRDKSAIVFGAETDWAVAKHDQLRFLCECFIYICHLLFVGGQADKGVQFLQPQALQLHDLQLRIKTGLGDGGDVDAIFAERFTDCALI